MSRTKILIAIVILIPVLLVSAAAFLLANPEYYREQVLEAAKEQTGFDLEINGEMKWRYWPPIALRLTDVAVMPAGQAKPLASFKEMAIDLELLPLLFGSKELVVNGLSIDGMTVNAIVHKNGKANWETPEQAPTEPATTTESEKSDFGVDVRSLQITNTHIDYVDKAAGSRYEVSIPRIETGPFRFGQPTQLNIEMVVNDPVGNMTVDFAANGKVTFDSAFEEIIFSALRLDQTVTMPDFPRIELAVQLDGSFNTVTSKLDTDIAGRFDNTKLNGKLAVDMSNKMSAVFNLTLDRINLNPYLGVTETSSAPTNGPAPLPEDVEVLPLALLNENDLDGTLNIGSLTYDTYQFSGMTMTVKNRAQQLNVDMSMKGYDGTIALQFDANTSGNGSGATHLKVADIDITKLLEFESLTGSLNMDSKTRFAGHMMSDVMNTLDGKSKFNIHDGTIDVSTIKKVAVVIDGLRGKSSGIGTWPDMMPFANMKGNHDFMKGTKQGQNFDFALENMTVTGGGGFDYFKNTLDYNVTMLLNDTTTGQFRVAPGLSGIEWPIHCQGTFDASPVDLCLADNNALKKLLANVAKEAVKRKGEELLRDTAQKKLGVESEEELKQKAEAALKKEVEKQLTDENKEKAKNLLKGLFKRDD